MYGASLRETPDQLESNPTESSACGSRARDGRGRRRGAGPLLGLLRLEPGVEVLLAERLDDDRHEAMVAAAELRALAAVDARLVGVHLEPRLVHVARNRILLDAEFGHPPGMDDVIGRD